VEDESITRVRPMVIEEKITTHGPFKRGNDIYAHEKKRINVCTYRFNGTCQGLFGGQNQISHEKESISIRMETGILKTEENPLCENFLG